MLKATWWQWFWRWLVALEFIVFAVGDLEVRIAWSALHAAGLPTMASFSSELVIGAVALGWLTAALISKALLLVCVPMLVLVELVAWANRWRRRRHSRKVDMTGWPAVARRIARNARN